MAKSIPKLHGFKGFTSLAHNLGKAMSTVKCPICVLAGRDFRIQRSRGIAIKRLSTYPVLPVV
jgi:hypothetical protein